MKVQTEYDSIETLCVLYWIHLADLEVEKAQNFVNMLNIHFKSAPLRQFPFYLKKRVELHDLLVSVADACEADLLDPEFRIGVFKVLNDIYKELDGAKRAGYMEAYLRKSEKLFVYYSGLRLFQFDHRIDPKSEDTVLPLSDDEFSYYYKLLQEVIGMCEVTSGESVVEEPMDKSEFVKIFKDLGQESFQKFNGELFNQFVRVFCFGLKFFHVILGRPKHFQRSDILSDDFSFPESAGTILSSCESVNESVDSFSHPEIRISNSLNNKKKQRTVLRDIIRSRSPPRESEIMKAEGILWDDSASDVLSVSGSSTKRVKWTPQESSDLVDGVKKYGVGQWAFIKADGRLNLGHKSNVQLKDRWRNLVKNDPRLKTLK